jgi:hypothetical protein
MIRDFLHENDSVLPSENWESPDFPFIHLRAFWSPKYSVRRSVCYEGEDWFIHLDHSIMVMTFGECDFGLLLVNINHRTPAVREAIIASSNLTTCLT